MDYHEHRPHIDQLHKHYDTEQVGHRILHYHDTDPDDPQITFIEGNGIRGPRPEPAYIEHLAHPDDAQVGHRDFRWDHDHVAGASDPPHKHSYANGAYSIVWDFHAFVMPEYRGEH